MKSAPTLLAALAGLVHLAAAQTVSGKAEGFAAGVTGGGSVPAVEPADIDELKKYLTDDEPRVIALSKEYDFTESEGKETGNVCASWGTGSACQKIIQKSCDSKSPASTETWYKAPTQPIDVGNNKTIIGVGSKGAIKGKGLRMQGSNVIIQNIAVTDLNPKYVWGGDAIGFDGADLVWVDHVTTARTGRQHYVFGFNPSKRITLSNNFINGESPYSTGCNGYHYWTFEMVGTADQITMKNNYIYKTSGRSPALSGGTLLHAVNNVWDDNDGHALEGGDNGARGLFEGNVWINVKALVSDYAGKLFAADSSNASRCKSALGRNCEANEFDKTTNTFPTSDNAILSRFSGYSAPAVKAAGTIKTSVPNNAGAGKLGASSSSSSKAVSDSADTAEEAVATKPAAPPAPHAPAKAADSSSGSVPLYGQCGGQGYSGATTCASGKCKFFNDWYSQCV